MTGVGAQRPELVQAWPDGQGLEELQAVQIVLVGVMTGVTQVPEAPQARPLQQPPLGQRPEQGWPLSMQGGGEGAHRPVAALQAEPEQQPPFGEAALHCWLFWMQDELGQAGLTQVPISALLGPGALE